MPIKHFLFDPPSEMSEESISVLAERIYAALKKEDNADSDTADVIHHNSSHEANEPPSRDNAIDDSHRDDDEQS